MKRKHSETVEEEEEKEKEPAAKRRKIDDNKEENTSNMATENEDTTEENFPEEGDPPINPIFDVIRRSDIEEIRTFITAEKKKDDFNIDAVDECGLTPLHHAIERRDHHIVKLLIQNGADVNFEVEEVLSNENELASPLHYAIFLKDADVAKVLVDANADIEIRDGDGRQPIHCAVVSGVKEIIGLFFTNFNLITYSPEIYSTDKAGNTLLHLAATSNNIELVRSLAVFPALLQQKNSMGKTPLDEVIKNNKTEVAKVLIEAYDNISLPLPGGCLHNAAAYGLPKIMELLIKKGIKVDSVIKHDGIDMTPLFFATVNDRIAAVNILIQNGANVHLEFRGESLLHYAVNTGKLGMVETLVKAGIDINTITAAGPTILHEAIRKLESLPNPISLSGMPVSKPVGWETIEKLVELGANIEGITSNNSEVSKILKVAKSADLSADFRSNSIPSEIKLLLTEGNMQQLFLKRFETYLMKYGSACSFDDYRTFLSNEELPNKLIGSLTNFEKTGLLDKLEENSIFTLEAAEGSMLHITEGISSAPYSVLLKRQSPQDQDNGTATNTLNFYEENPEYKIPGAFLASILQDEHQLLNEMLHNINFAKAIESILNICIKQTMKMKLTSIWTKYEEELIKNPLAQVTQIQGAEIEWLKEEMTQEKKVHKQEMIEIHDTHARELKQFKEEFDLKLAKMMQFVQQLEAQVSHHSNHQGDHSHASITHGEASLSGEMPHDSHDGIS